MAYYAEQLKSAKSQIEMTLDLCPDETRKVVSVVSCALEASVSTLILIKNRNMSSHDVAQLVSKFCTVLTSEELISSMDLKGCLRAWPDGAPPLGRYHFAARARSAFQLATMFHESMFSEIGAARLIAYPNTFIDAMSIEQMGHWVESLWSELVQRRVELVEWQPYEIHQWRDGLLRQWETEFNQMYPPQRPKVEPKDFTSEICNEVRELPKEILAGEVKKKLLTFFREYQEEPEDEHSTQFNGVFNVRNNGRLVFQQYLSPLIVGIQRTIQLAVERQIEVPATRRMEQMLRATDVRSAFEERWAVAAELEQLRTWKSRTSINTDRRRSPNEYSHDEKVNSVLTQLRKHKVTRGEIRRAASQKLSKYRNNPDWKVAVHQAEETFAAENQLGMSPDKR